MLTKQQTEKLFFKLNTLLKAKGERAEVGIVGGTVMCLVFNARNATRDVDAIFEPTKLVRELAKQIGIEEGVGPDWLNDGAKAYLIGEFQKSEVMNLSHLRVWAPVPDYMLAMKSISARWDSNDKDDVIFLIKLLDLKKPKEVFKIIEKYYPKKMIPPKTQFLIEELLN
jgi:hypothetical protein